jgi:hypothetical protein
MWVRISPPGEEWAARYFVTSLSPSAVALFLEERALRGQTLGKGGAGLHKHRGKVVESSQHLRRAIKN